MSADWLERVRDAVRKRLGWHMLASDIVADAIADALAIAFEAHWQAAEPQSARDALVREHANVRAERDHYRYQYERYRGEAERLTYRLKEATDRLKGAKAHGLAGETVALMGEVIRAAEYADLSALSDGVVHAWEAWLAAGRPDKWLFEKG